MWTTDKLQIPRSIFVHVLLLNFWKYIFGVKPSNTPTIGHGWACIAYGHPIDGSIIGQSFHQWIEHAAQWVKMHILLKSIDCLTNYTNGIGMSSNLITYQMHRSEETSRHLDINLSCITLPFRNETLMMSFGSDETTKKVS